jgi:predicted metalloprotease
MVLVTPDEVPTEIYTEYEVLVGDLITDVEDYWATWFEEQGASWQPPRVYTRAEGEAELRCDDNVLDVEGSFYCPAENYVAFAESRQVLPLYLYLGDYAVAMVISHEFGHAVQSSLAIEHVRDRFKELQADCFAGAWFKDYQDDGSFRDLAEPFTQAVSAMRTVDQGETLSERYDALLTGFNGGPKACIDEFPESGFDFDLAADE